MNKGLVSVILGVFLTGCSSLTGPKIIDENRIKTEKYSLNGKAITEVDPKGVVTVIYDFNGDEDIDMVEVSDCKGTIKYWKGSDSSKKIFKEAERRFLNYK